MNIFQIDFGTPEYDEAFKLRYNVLRAPLGLDYDPEIICQEYPHLHFGVYDDAMKIQGYYMMVLHDTHILKMKQVSVDESKQKSGIGRSMVEHCIHWARLHGYKQIDIHAREYAVPFYEKLGFKKSGKRFEEVGLPHHSMTRTI